ncbi:MAG TPA: ATP-binding protein [Bacteroidia bacterium]|jgi:signal transduction histidine kinase|nr:ATP-binding protein [Bacteroidia bacterium]
MPNTRKPRPLLLFYILVVYVLIQFGWWAFLLVRQNNEVHNAQVELLELRVNYGEKEKANEIALKESLEKKLHKEWMMVLGEGSVFLVLLILGISRTRNSFRKEAEMNERQKNFILSVTHELRSPLASIRLQMETLKKRELPKEKQEEIQNNAIEDIDRLNTLIENILVATRLDNHLYILKKSQGDISSAVERTIQRLQPVISKDHVMKIDVQADVNAEFDEVALQSVLSNLIENAAKYSPDGKTILVQLKKNSNGINIVVKDEGPGIPDDEKPKVFDRFYRSGNEETRRTKGTGLGLYIVKNLVTAHGWEIGLRNDPSGGCIFEISIPKS